MDPVDRIAAYLAGELDTAEIAAVKAELARDPELRARVAAMRRADEALGLLDPPQPTEGFEQRLRQHLEPVLATELEGSAQDTVTTPRAAGTFDELAERRAHRTRRRMPWAPALGGAAAAALAVLAVVNIGSGGDSDLAATEDMADADDGAGMEMFDADAAEEGADAEMMAEPLPEGPVIVASDRSFDEEELDLLLGSPDLTGVTAQHLGPDQGTVVAGEWSAALGVEQDLTAMAPEADAGDEAADDADEPTDDADEPATEESLTRAAPLRSTGRSLTEADETDVRRCLAALTQDSPSAIPAYVELGTYDGEDVLVFGLVTVDPSTGAFTRPEIWVMSRADCEPRYFNPE